MLGAVHGRIPFLHLLFQTLLSSVPLKYSRAWPTACTAAREMWNSGARARFCWQLGSSPEQQARVFLVLGSASLLFFWFVGN